MRLENRHLSNAESFVPRNRKRYLALSAILVLATVLAYLPSLQGGFIWDDPDYVVNNSTLRDANGLLRMWTDIRSLPQWYPLVHTTFWVEYQLFGLQPLAFKVTNLTLHIATALLLWRLLLHLNVPGAFLALAVFALHPVHVESVAWITERKNALSGLFYVLAFGAYWRSRLLVVGCESGQNGLSTPTQTPPPTNANPRGYTAALCFFGCALLSKTVTASFPAAVLVVIWWKAGRVRWRDIKPLLPFFAMGIAMGVVTASLERNFVGAVGSEWDHSPTWYGELAARTLIAGRAIWFYLGKLVWPDPIAFMYERWTIDVRDWTQWIYPVAVVFVFVVLVLSRKRLGRGPVAALLLFVGTLFPALGFFNVFPHRYSFVADHFQHLASIAVTTLVCAGIALALQRTNQLWLCVIVQGALIVILGALTFRQGFAYKSVETLWQDTAKKSPRAWVAYTNLGKLAADAGRQEQAIAYHAKALQLAPYVADTWYNMAAVYATQEDWPQAVAAFSRVIELSKRNPRASVNLDALIGLARLAGLHENDAAKAEALFRQAIAFRGDYPPARLHYARFLKRVGRTGDAIEQYAEMVELAPNDFGVRAELGTMLLNAALYSAAAEQLEIAVRLQPTSQDAWTNLGFAQLGSGQKQRAVASFGRALSVNSGNELAKKGLIEARK